MSNRIKVLTVQFDVTHLDSKAINALLGAAVAQAEEFEIYDPKAEYCMRSESAEVLNTSVREVEVDDT